MLDNGCFMVKRKRLGRVSRWRRVFDRGPRGLFLESTPELQVGPVIEKNVDRGNQFPLPSDCFGVDTSPGPEPMRVGPVRTSTEEARPTRLPGGEPSWLV